MVLYLVWAEKFAEALKSHQIKYNEFYVVFSHGARIIKIS